MIKKMLVNATHPEENRVAIVEDGILSELDIEIAGQEQTKGNIYKAAVVRVETGLQAAFVDYGAERLGFLQLGELHPSLYPQRDDAASKSRPRINEILQRGQELLVQITKEERGNKGAALTTFLSLPGRYMVLMPEDDARGISRKIPDGAERKALKQAIAAMDVPENMGIIVRTAAIGKSSEELQRDLDYLLKLHSNITNHAKQTKAPALIYQESNLVIRSIRDYFMPDMDEVLIDDPDVFREAKEFFTQVMPAHANLVKLHQEQRPVFSKYQIEEQIETIAQSQVSMPSGGSIVIDQTEALVAIDVNSGKMASEQGIEATAYKSNLEAASEVARQLRLRDLGGLVVIDFIDMRDRKHTREVEKRLKEALKNDKARVTVGRISQFGLLEMSRQRIKQSLAAAAWNACPHCKGRGKVKSTEAQAVAIMRKIHAAVAKKQIERVEAKVPAEVAEYLLNTRREELLDMERRYKTAIYLSGGHDLVAEEVEVEFKKREKRPTDSKDESAPVTAATALADTAAAERAHQPAGGNTDESAQPHPPTQKKRSRRGRGEATKSEENSPEQTSEEQPATDQPTSESEQTASEEAATEAPRRRRRRRRGRRGAGQNTAEATTDTPDVEESVQTEAVEKTEQQPEAAAEEEPKPKRRGRRRKPATENKSDALPATPESSEESTAGEQQTGDVTEPAAEETVTKPKRRRSPRKKKDEPVTDGAAEAKPTKEAPVQAQEATVEPQGEETPAKPKRRRSPRKKAEEAPVPTAETTGTEQETPAEEKPKRRRPGRPKKVAEPVAADAKESVSVQAPVAGEAEETKPKRRRRTTAKPTEANDVTDSGTETVKTEPAETEKPKPARRPRRKKAEEPPTQTEKPVIETAPAEETPAPKPKRRPARGKKTVDEQTQPPAAEPVTSTEADAEQKPKPRRRSPRKKATPEGEAEE